MKLLNYYVKLLLLRHDQLTIRIFPPYSSKSCEEKVSGACTMTPSTSWSGPCALRTTGKLAFRVLITSGTECSRSSLCRNSAATAEAGGFLPTEELLASRCCPVPTPSVRFKALKLPTRRAMLNDKHPPNQYAVQFKRDIVVQQAATVAFFEMTVLCFCASELLW
eukprot:914936-Rhodomonas_salina.2